MADAASGVVAVGVNTSLRLLQPYDRVWLDTWLSAIAATTGYPYADAASIFARGGVRSHVIERDGQAAGVVVVVVGLPRTDAAIIELIATPPEHARRGAGMRAAALIEDELRSAGVRTLYAPSAAKHGISMYFWIRLGYRPLLREAWPCARDGIAWLSRDIG